MIDIISLPLLVVIIWWVWSSRREKREEKAREKIIIDAYTFKPPKAHVTTDAAFASREEIKRRGLLR
jgi:hypothetical protein